MPPGAPSIQYKEGILSYLGLPVQTAYPEQLRKYLWNSWGQNVNGALCLWFSLLCNLFSKIHECFYSLIFLHDFLGLILKTSAIMSGLHFSRFLFLLPKPLMLHAQSCPTLCEPLDYNPPGSSVHEISQARILKWVAISYSRGSFYPRDQTCDSWVFFMGGRILYHCTTWKAPRSLISSKTKQDRTFHSSWVM